MKDNNTYLSKSLKELNEILYIYSKYLAQYLSLSEHTNY